MTTRELIEKLADKPAWRFALAIYARVVVIYIIVYLTVVAISFI